jgi:two-component system, chemotaxis family, protein-glutamate methylesterase/glutaminase
MPKERHSLFAITFPHEEPGAHLNPSSLIVIGGSAGGLEPLKEVVQGLPSGFPAAVLVVIHTAPTSSGALAGMLQRSSLLRATYPDGDTVIEAGTIYVAPPDHHLLVHDGIVLATRGPRENGFRPAIDPLFRSASRSFGRNVIGVILSGALDDGSFGLRAIKEAGGRAIVQHPEEALVSGMPLSAIQHVEVDHIVPVAEIPRLLVELVTQSSSVLVGGNGDRGKRGEVMSNPSRGLQSGPGGTFDHTVADDTLAGPPSSYTCPECGGALWKLDEGHSFRFRCHTGHGFTPETLLDGQNHELEKALWSAVRVLKERAGIHEQMASRMQKGGLADLAQRYQERAVEERNKSQLIEGMLSQNKAG